MKRSTLNEVAMWFIAFYVAVLPLFLGGNRPLVWVGAMLVMALFGLAYFIAMLVINDRLAISASSLRPYLFLFGLFMAYQLVQTWPWAPSFLTPLPDGYPNIKTISIAPHETMLAFVRWFTFAGVAFFSMQAAANRQRANRFTNLLFGVAFFQAFLGFMLYFQFNDASIIGEKWTYIGSLTGSFINRNNVATYLASGAVLAIAVAQGNLAATGEGASLRVEKLIRAVLLPAAGFVLIIIDIAATKSRMGFFVTVIGIVVIATLIVLFSNRSETGKPKKPKRNPGPLVIVLGLIVLIAIFASYGAGTMERLGQLDGSADVRLSLYSQILEMIRARPLSGFGGGTFANAFPLFHDLPVNVDFIWDKAHNSYLALWSEYGLVFGSIPLIIIALAVWQMAFRAKGKPSIGSLAAIAVVILAAVHSAVDFSLEIQGYTVYFIAIVANGLARVTPATRSKKGR